MDERELSYKYRKLGLTTLQKALDEICPKIEDKELIKERALMFNGFEEELDQEWEELEEEAAHELNLFKEERDLILSKIEKTRNTSRVQNKVDGFELKKQKRVEYLSKKKTEAIQSALTDLKRDKITKQFNDKIKRSETRYNTIINNTLNSDNSDSVSRRLEVSRKIWERKYKELKFKFELKEAIHNNKRMEYDQIRLAVLGFEEEFERIALWCVLSGVSTLDCYKEVKNRMNMIGLNTVVIDEIIEDIKIGKLSIDN